MLIKHSNDVTTTCRWIRNRGFVNFSCFLACLVSTVGNRQKKTLSTQIQMCRQNMFQVCITCMPLFKGSWPLKISVCDLSFISSPSIDFAGSKPLQRKAFLQRMESIHRKQNTWRNLCKWGRSFHSWTSKSQHDLELEVLFKRRVSHGASVLVCVVLEPKDTFWKISWNKKGILSVRNSTLLLL